MYGSKETSKHYPISIDQERSQLSRLRTVRRDCSVSYYKHTAAFPQLQVLLRLFMQSNFTEREKMGYGKGQDPLQGSNLTIF